MRTDSGSIEQPSRLRLTAPKARLRNSTYFKFGDFDLILSKRDSMSESLREDHVGSNREFARSGNDFNWCTI